MTTYTQDEDFKYVRDGLVKVFRWTPLMGIGLGAGQVRDLHMYGVIAVAIAIGMLLSVDGGKSVDFYKRNRHHKEVAALPWAVAYRIFGIAFSFITVFRLWTGAMNLVAFVMLAIMFVGAYYARKAGKLSHHFLVAENSGAGKSA